MLTIKDLAEILVQKHQLDSRSAEMFMNVVVETIHEDKCPYTLMKSAGETSYVLKDKDGDIFIIDAEIARKR